MLLKARLTYSRFGQFEKKPSGIWPRIPAKESSSCFTPYGIWRRDEVAFTVNEFAERLREVNISNEEKGEKEIWPTRLD